MTYEDEPIVLEDWQIDWLHDHSLLRAVEKAPQIGYSWLNALEALWNTTLHLDETEAFVSVDQREAQEKILYARKLWEGMPELFQLWVPTPRVGVEELWLGTETRPSRLLSLPNTSALRGRRMSVRLDESDFYRDGGRSALRAALGRITRGGRVTMGSTCFGEETQLDQTMQEKGSKFSKSRFPWNVATSPDILAVIEISRGEMDHADFEEEYECVRGAAMGDSFSPELLRDSQHAFPIETLDTIPDDGGDLVLGYDVGASDHPAIGTVLRQFGDGRWRQIALDEFRRMRLRDQDQQLFELMREHPNMRLAIDAIGIGQQMADSLEDEFGQRRVMKVRAGTHPSGQAPMDKYDMAVALRRGLESKELELAPDREQMKQLRRTKLLAGGRLEQRSEGRRSHFDRFWAVTYAWWLVKQGRRRSVYNDRELIVIGG